MFSWKQLILCSGIALAVTIYSELALSTWMYAISYTKHTKHRKYHMMNRNKYVRIRSDKVCESVLKKRWVSKENGSSETGYRKKMGIGRKFHKHHRTCLNGTRFMIGIGTSQYLIDLCVLYRIAFAQSILNSFTPCHGVSVSWFIRIVIFLQFVEPILSINQETNR
eukprot:95540_1